MHQKKLHKPPSVGYFGAEDRSRTGTPGKASVFETDMSTYSITSAQNRKYYTDLYEVGQ